MQRPYMPVIIIALAIAVGALGYAYYTEHRKTTGIELSVDPNGITLQKK